MRLKIPYALGIPYHSIHTHACIGLVDAWQQCTQCLNRHCSLLRWPGLTHYGLAWFGLDEMFTVG